MAIPSVYINLEDDVDKTLTRLKHNRAAQVILVCPKRCFLFSDPENLLRLKRETDELGKEVFVLTMDERGQQYAQAAGFQLKFLPKAGGSPAFSDVRMAKKTILIEPQDIIEEKPVVKKIQQTEKPLAKIKTIKASPNLEASIGFQKTKILTTPKLEVKDTLFPVADSEVVEEEAEEKSSVAKVITGVVALSLTMALLLVFVILPKATVVVYPRSEPVTRDMEISMTTAAQVIDSTKLIIPAVKIDEVATVNGAFQSSGKQQVGNKAIGTIKIYNFTKLPLNLKASTTTLNVGGKTYNLVNDILGLKPTTYKNAKTKEVDENSLTDSVQIIATSGGDDFNLPAGTRMEITNQIFGSKPLLLYAKTDSEITGGTTRYLSLISQDDQIAAQSQLTNQSMDQIRTKLQANGLVLQDKAFTVQVTQFTIDNPVGTQTPLFHGNLQVKINGLAYKSTDLDHLIKQRIAQTLSADKNLVDKQPTSTDVSIKTLDYNNQVASLTVHYEGLAVYDIDLPDISTQLVGKSREQANEILRSKAQIERVDMTLAPVWQKNFPYFASKINVSIAK